MRPRPMATNSAFGVTWIADAIARIGHFRAFKHTITTAYVSFAREAMIGARSNAAGCTLIVARYAHVTIADVMKRLTLRHAREARLVFN